MRRSLAILLIVASIWVYLPARQLFAQPQAQQKTLTIWTRFNDANPQNSQDQWLADALKEYTAAADTAVTNVNQPYDQINSKLNVAVHSGGEVPDAAFIDSQQIGFFSQNGTLIDLTDFVKNAPWFKDLTVAGLQSCTAPDGKILCVPTSTAGTLIYYWKDLYPNGFPATTDQLLEAAKDLKARNKFAITMKASEKVSVTMTYFGLIKSFGGEIADQDGRAVWANPHAVAAISFVRDLFVNKYAPAVALAPGFDNEEPFKRGDAAAIMAGSWSYVFLNPLIAPDGTKFDKKSGSLAAAYDGGKAGFAPPLAKSGSKPYSVVLSTAWAIPKGTANVEAAKAFIDFQMTSARIAKFALAYGGLPSLNSSLDDKGFQSPYWKAVAQYLKDYSVPAPTLVQYDKGLTLLGDTVNRLMTDPSKDILAELKAAQNEYNASLQ